eukprot:scaffold253788_cov18-Tisochrysis_lutea.AAC.1
MASVPSMFASGGAHDRAGSGLAQWHLHQACRIHANRACVPPQGADDLQARCSSMTCKEVVWDEDGMKLGKSYFAPKHEHVRPAGLLLEQGIEEQG